MHYLLSCDHVIERVSKPPKLVRCVDCPKTNDGNPKRRVLGECTPDGLLNESYMNDIDGQATHVERRTPPFHPERERVTVDLVAGEYVERIVADPVTDEQQARYDAAIADGATEDEAVEAAVVDEDDSDVPGAITEQSAAAILERYAAAKREHSALRVWNKQDETIRGARPATPNLDAMNADVAAGVRPEDRLVRSSTSSTRTPKAKKPAPELPAGSVQFFRNGSPLRGKHNRLSSLAGYCKLPIVELRKTLADAGVEQPESSSWEITLTNGTKIAATITSDSAVQA